MGPYSEHKTQGLLQALLEAANAIALGASRRAIHNISSAKIILFPLIAFASKRSTFMTGNCSLDCPAGRSGVCFVAVNGETLKTLKR